MCNFLPITLRAAALLVVGATASLAKASEPYAGTANDFMEISQLFSRYNYTIDNGDDVGWSANFTVDGVFRDPAICAIGRKALVAVVGHDPHVGKDQNQFHMPTLGPITYLDRDHATVHSTVIVVRETGFGKQPGGILVSGTYDDRLSRVSGHWLFAYRWVHRPSNAPAVPCARTYPGSGS